MESSKPSRLVPNLLVLITLIGLVLAGWLTGHILRHITPDYQHPPTEEVDPHIKTGYLPGQEIQIIIIGSADGSGKRVYTGQEFLLRTGCVGTTYYTSLPAKCHTLDGQLVQAGGFGSGIMVTPKDK